MLFVIREPEQTKMSQTHAVTSVNDLMSILSITLVFFFRERHISTYTNTEGIVLSNFPSFYSKVNSLYKITWKLYFFFFFTFLLANMSMTVLICKELRSHSFGLYNYRKVYTELK